MNYIWSKLGRKVITRARVHCVLQTSKYPVDIPSLGSQSEHAKMDIHWFGTVNTLALIYKNE